jgi:hypothetical protein
VLLRHLHAPPHRAPAAWASSCTTLAAATTTSAKSEARSRSPSPPHNFSSS